MIFLSRRAAKKARMIEPRRIDIHNGCDSTTGHDFELSCTETIPWMRRRDLPKFQRVTGRSTKHRADGPRVEWRAL